MIIVFQIFYYENLFSRLSTKVRDFVRTQLREFQYLDDGQFNIVTVENIKHERFSRNPRIARTLTEFGWVREMNEGVKRIYSEMESYFLHEPKYTEPGNKVVLTLENNILSRHLRVNDKMMKKYDEFNDLNDDEKAILHIMYNTGEKMTTALAARITNRGRNFASKLLKSLVNKEILEWHGTSKQDRNQYYTLAE